jgi:hypothetical protein
LQGSCFFLRRFIPDEPKHATDESDVNIKRILS